jgi:hypothetical protein
MAPRNSTTPSPTERDRQLQRTLLAIRLGATVFGVLAGVVCYLALGQFTAIGLVPAFVIGLIFALLTRTASASLARDWLVRNASRAGDGRRDPPPPRAG